MTKPVFKKESRGSLVIEAAIIFFFVFFIIFFVMYICFLLYQMSSLQIIANQAAEKGAESWNNSLEFKAAFRNVLDKDIENNLYQTIYDYSKEAKLETIDKYIRKELKIDDKNAYNAGRNNIKVKLKNHFGYKSLVVEVSKEITTPFDEIVKIFGLKDGFNISVKSQSVIDNNAEFIRNTDFILDIGDEIDTDNKINNFMNKMKKVIGSFF